VTDPELGGMDLTVVAVADSEPYVRMSAAMFDAMPGRRHTVGLAVVRSPITPAPAQLRRAVAGSGLADRRVPVLTLPELRRLVRRRVPDVVMLNCTARVTDALADILPTGRRRPVVVTTLPGPALPAGEHEWLHRARADLLVLHSLREVTAFSELGEKLGAGTEVALAGLPLPAAREHRGARPHRVVFAAQDHVPATAPQREHILEALAGLGTGLESDTVTAADMRSPAAVAAVAAAAAAAVAAGRAAAVGGRDGEVYDAAKDILATAACLRATAKAADG
jgi:hypothetical protein